MILAGGQRLARIVRERLLIDTEGPLSSGQARGCPKWHCDCVQLLTPHLLLQRLFPLFQLTWDEI